MPGNCSPTASGVGRQGRVVIPASLRRARGRLVLEKPRRIRQRLKERYAQVHGESKLVDELIAERRLEGTKGH